MEARSPAQHVHNAPQRPRIKMCSIRREPPFDNVISIRSAARAGLLGASYVRVPVCQHQSKRFHLGCRRCGFMERGNGEHRRGRYRRWCAAMRQARPRMSAGRYRSRSSRHRRSSSTSTRGGQTDVIPMLRAGLGALAAGRRVTAALVKVQCLMLASAPCGAVAAGGTGALVSHHSSASSRA